MEHHRRKKYAPQCSAEPYEAPARMASMDIARKNPDNISARAKAEKYAKILAKTIVNPDGDASNYGQNAFFYDAAEGLLCAVVLLLAEYLPPTLADRTEPPDDYSRGGMAQAQMLDEQDADRRSKPYRTPTRGGHRS